MPQMATLNYKHSGTPGRSYHRAHCTNNNSTIVQHLPLLISDGTVGILKNRFKSIVTCAKFNEKHIEFFCKCLK